jgi:hypothetical protein
MPAKDRGHCVQARHRSRDLLDWFFSRYELVRGDPGQVVPFDGMKDVYWPYLVRVVKGLIRYKELAHDSIMDSVEGCTAAAVKAQVQKCFQGVAGYKAAWLSWGNESVNSLAWPTDDQHTFGVRALAKPKERRSKSICVHYTVILTLLIRQR